ncbi:MAG: hypothetical protein Q4D35_03210 [Ruminococcus sp.]|nr:hypothetical protein [Ruminococcus sp.]
MIDIIAKIAVIVTIYILGLLIMGFLDLSVKYDEEGKENGTDERNSD